MLRLIRIIWALAAIIGVVAPLGAQTPDAPPQSAERAQPRPMDRAQLRHQIYVMEGALTRAVEFGAQSLNRDLRAVVPDVFMLAGEAQARGVYLEGYGIFFDVQVPIMRQSMMWSLKMILDRDDAGTKAALDQVRQVMKNPALDPRERASLDSAIKRIELQLNPMPFTGANPFAAAARPQTMSAQPAPDGVNAASTVGPMPQDVQPSMPAVPIDKGWMMDPNKAYTEAVQNAIIEAMVDYSGPMRIGPQESLTVAARDNEPRDSLAPQNPLEETVTLLYTITSSDLAAYRSGTIDRDEAKRRVIVREF
jgi:hypothetical protein